MQLHIELNRFIALKFKLGNGYHFAVDKTPKYAFGDRPCRLDERFIQQVSRKLAQLVVCHRRITQGHDYFPKN
jgi:hypothetical protein